MSLPFRDRRQGLVARDNPVTARKKNHRCPERLKTINYRLLVWVKNRYLISFRIAQTNNNNLLANLPSVREPCPKLAPRFLSSKPRGRVTLRKAEWNRLIGRIRSSSRPLEETRMRVASWRFKIRARRNCRLSLGTILRSSYS